MVFVLRSERAPARVLREVDERGTLRTMWLWRHGAWAVVCQPHGGEILCASSPTLLLRLHVAQGVTVVKVEERPLEPTIPAPRASRRDPISSVHPVAAVVPEIGQDAPLEPDGRDVDAERRARLGHA